MKQLRSEAAAVAERYKRRNVGDLYSMLRSEVMLSHQERQTALLRLFRKNAPAPLQELRVLEVGCGTGRNLLELIQLGFAPWNLVGNELLAERAKRARRTLPESTKILEGDAVCLPIERSSFDVVYASRRRFSTAAGE